MHWGDLISCQGWFYGFFPIKETNQFLNFMQHYLQSTKWNCTHVYCIETWTTPPTAGLAAMSFVACQNVKNLTSKPLCKRTHWDTNRILTMPLENTSPTWRNFAISLRDIVQLMKAPYMELPLCQPCHGHWKFLLGWQSIEPMLVRAHCFVLFISYLLLVLDLS